MATGKEVDFDRLMQKVAHDHKYRTTPSASWLLELMDDCRPYVESEAIDLDRKVKKVIRGIEYEFTIVGRDWYKTKTLRDLDKPLEEVS